MDLQLDEEVWLAGKGPSLDTFDWSQAGRHRIAINEAAFVVPECFAAIGCDYPVLDRYLEELDPSIIVLRKKTHVRYKFQKMFLWNYEQHAQIRVNTAPSAISVIYHLGARTIHFVGFDSFSGVGTYANRIKEIKAEGKNKDCFRNINQAIRKVIEQYKIKAIWEHELCIN
jgi:hypothetical protein